MSRRRVYSADTLAAMGRFFDALDSCIEHKLIKNNSRFCEDNGIDKRHFYHQRKDFMRGYFEVSWMLPLVRCGISPAWLLTGKGSMFDASAVRITPKTQPCLFD